MMTNDTENKEFYFRVFEDGDVMVMVIDANGNYSQHMSTDATESDGDGAFGPYHWNDSQAWTKTTRAHAESMLQFTFTDLEEDEKARRTKEVENFRAESLANYEQEYAASRRPDDDDPFEKGTSDDLDI